MDDLLSIIIEDRNYAVQLMTYMRNNWPRALRTVIAGGTDEFINTVNSGKLLQGCGRVFILAGEEFADDISKQMEKAKSIAGGLIFKYTLVYDRKLTEGEGNIFIYTRPSEIMRYLLYESKKYAIKKSIYSVLVSPWNRSGKSTLFSALAICASAEGDNVLCVNLSGSSSLFKYEGLLPENTYFPELAYILKRDRIPSEEYFGSLKPLVNTGITLIDAAGYAPELNELSGDNIGKLLEGIDNYGKYDSVFFDTGGVLDEINMALLGSADNIIITYNPLSAYDEAKYDDFVKVVERGFDGGEAVKAKFRFVMNDFIQNEYIEALNTADERCAARMPYIPDGNINFNINSKFGLLISEIWRKIYEYR